MYALQSAPRFRRSGLTLVEVLCATLIAGTLLSSLLLAQASQLRQLSSAGERREAVAALHGQLQHWTSGPSEFPDSGDHPLPQREEWICRVAFRSTPETRLLQARIARVEIRDRRAADRHRFPLATVELLVPE